MTTETCDYLDADNKRYRVVALIGPISSFYNGKNYDIFSKIVLPPNFPRVPPIFSVSNFDPSSFFVNQKFEKNILPDETF